MNIPIYRAKKIDSDKYEIGFLLNNMIVTAYEQEVKRDGIYWKSITTSKIDPATLAIHFPDMLDSQGNKIFASLSEDGKGGDIMQDDEYIGIAKYIDCQFVVEYENCIDNIDNGNFDAIGIQE